MKDHPETDSDFWNTQLSKQIMENLPVGLLLYRADSTVITASHEFHRLIGSKPSDFQNLSVQTFLQNGGVDWKPDPSLPENRIESRFRTPKGTQINLEFVCKRIVCDNPDTDLFIMMIRDVGKFQRILRALTDSESRIRGYFQQDLVGMARLSADGGFLEANNTFCRITGRALDEMLKLNQADLLSDCNRLNCRSVLRNIVEGEVESSILEWELLRPDRSRTAVRVHLSAEPDMYGDSATIVAIYQDIESEREAIKSAEERRQQLIRTERLATLGTLAAGTAHEISNPNQVILGNIELARELWEPLKEQSRINGTTLPVPLERMDRYLDRISEGAARISEIVENLKTYVRSAESPLSQPTDINKVVSQAYAFLERTVNETTDCFTLKLEEALPPVMANPGLLTQVVVNLVMNACQALETRDAAIELRTLQNESEIILEVSDEGSGIPDEILTRITEPFVTSRRSDGGTGLGLSISEGIAHDYGGRLEFANRETRGAVARLILPVSTE